MPIDSIVRNYIQDQKCDGALMINGKWGLGKSFYLREKLIPLLKGEDPKLKFIYVSLNGITDSSQLPDLIALEKWPFRKTKTFKVGATITGFLLDAIGKVPGVSKEIGSQSLSKLGGIKTHDFLNFENTILCFDDLERNKIQPSILGFINTHFVETAKVKTILIGNEEEIDPSIDYHRIKEKLIFRTISFENSVSVETLAAHYQDEPNFKQFILSHSPFLEAKIKQFGISNLRTLIFSLDVISQLYQTHILGKAESLDQSVLLIVLLIANEFKNGKLQSNDYKSFKGLDNLSSDAYAPILSGIRARKTGPAPELPAGTMQTYEIAFYDKYDLYNEPNFFFYTSLYTFVLSGDLDKALVQKECKGFEEMQEKKRLRETPEKAALQIVECSYWATSDQQFDDAMSQFLGFLDEGKYLFYEYAAFFEILTELIKHELWDETEPNMKTRVIQGCKTSMPKSDIPSSYLDTLEQNCRFSTDPDINKLVRDEFARRKGIGENESIEDYFRELQGPWHIFHPKYATFEPFAIIDSKAFADRFVEVSLMGIRQYNAILDQHNQTQNIKDSLGTFADQYAELKMHLYDHLKSEKGKIRRLLFNTTIAQLTKLEIAIK